MKLMSLKQFEKKSRGSLMRFINGYLKTQSKKQIAIFAYTLAKSKLPRLRVTKRKPIESLGKGYGRQIFQAKYLPKRKTKRKFSKKQLAAQRLFAKRARAGTLRRR